MMSVVGIETLPEEIRSRVLASTGNATYRLVQQTDASEPVGGTYAMEYLNRDNPGRGRSSAGAHIDERTRNS